MGTWGEENDVVIDSFCLVFSSSINDLHTMTVVSIYSKETNDAVVC